LILQARRKLDGEQYFVFIARAKASPGFKTTYRPVIKKIDFIVEEYHPP